MATTSARPNITLCLYREEYDAVKGWGAQHNLTMADTLRQAMTVLTGVAIKKPINTNALSPEIKAARWLAKNPDATVRAALLRAIMAEGTVQ